MEILFSMAWHALRVANIALDPLDKELECPGGLPHFSNHFPEEANADRMDGGTESTPHAGCCGTRELTTPGDPILPLFCMVGHSISLGIGSSAIVDAIEMH